MTNEDIRDCENCKHYVLHDKTVNLPPIYACEKWECEFESNEEAREILSKIKDDIGECTYKETGCGSCKRQLDCPIEAEGR